MIVKAILLTLALLLLKKNGLAQKDLLMKFHQNDYKIRNIRIQRVSANYSLVDSFDIKSFKYNRSTTAFNVTMQSKFDLYNTTGVLVQAFRFASNEYRYFPLRFLLNFCAAYQSNVIGIYNWTGDWNPCNILKNKEYHVYNFVVDGAQLPPLIPNGEYKVKLVFMKSEDELGDFDAFLEVYRPFGMKKH